MVSEVVPWLVEFFAHTLLLTVMLWIMIKLQKFDYNFPGLLGSAVLGGGLDMIPHFGHLLAVPVLYFCVWKMTRASLFPDAAFTVVIAYTLMFAFNVLVLTALMGDLRPPERSAASDDTIPKPSRPSLAEAGTDAPPASAAGDPADLKTADKLGGFIAVKGLTRNGDKSSVTIQAGGKTRAVFLGEAVSVQADDGLTTVRFVALDDHAVFLEVRGQRLKYPLP